MVDWLIVYFTSHAVLFFLKKKKGIQMKKIMLCFMLYALCFCY